VWFDLGYSKKSNAVRRMKKVLVEGVDFCSDVSQSPTDGRPSDDFLLTIDGFKHFCLLAETEEGRNIRQYFIDIERAYRLQLERQLEGLYAAPSHTTPTFDYPAAQLQAIAGYASLSYTKAAIRRDFVVGIHYLERAREMVLTEVCFALAVNGSRSRAGVDLENCPDIQISIKDAIAHHNAKAANKQNARLGRGICDGQLSLW
jgi:phage anti-repressor protein